MEQKTEFYESFFPGQSKEEVKAEFGDFDLLSGLNTSSPQAALSSIGSFLDAPLTPPSPDSFSDFDNTNNRIGTRKSRSGQSFLDDFTSDLRGRVIRRSIWWPWWLRWIWILIMSDKRLKAAKAAKIQKDKMPCNKPRRDVKGGKKSVVKACSGGKEKNCAIW